MNTLSNYCRRTFGSNGLLRKPFAIMLPQMKSGHLFQKRLKNKIFCLLSLAYWGLFSVQMSVAASLDTVQVPSNLSFSGLLDFFKITPNAAEINEYRKNEMMEEYYRRYGTVPTPEGEQRALEFLVATQKRLATDVNSRATIEEAVGEIYMELIANARFDVAGRMIGRVHGKSPQQYSPPYKMLCGALQDQTNFAPYDATSPHAQGQLTVVTLVSRLSLLPNGGRKLKEFLKHVDASKNVVCDLEDGSRMKVSDLIQKSLEHDLRTLILSPDQERAIAVGVSTVNEWQAGVSVATSARRESRSFNESQGDRNTFKFYAAVMGEPMDSTLAPLSYVTSVEMKFGNGVACARPNKFAELDVGDFDNFFLRVVQQGVAILASKKKSSPRRTFEFTSVHLYYNCSIVIRFKTVPPSGDIRIQSVSEIVRDLRVIMNRG
jgi:hypothetical protein